MHTRGAHPVTVGQDSDVPASVEISLEESVDAMISQTGFDGVLVVKDGSDGAHAVHHGAWLHVPAREVAA